MHFTGPIDDYSPTIGDGNSFGLEETQICLDIKCTTIKRLQIQKDRLCGLNGCMARKKSPRFTETYSRGESVEFSRLAKYCERQEVTPKFVGLIRAALDVVFIGEKLPELKG